MGKPNTQNLKPCKPGQSGNPKGKPKGTLNRATIIRRWLEVTDQDGVSEADKLVLAQLMKGKKGAIDAFHALFDGGYGKMTDKQESKVEVDASIRGLSETADFLSGVIAKRSKGTLP